VAVPPLGKKQLYPEHVQDRNEVASTAYDRNRESNDIEDIANDMDENQKGREG
jgi:hypothetical protein